MVCKLMVKLDDCADSIGRLRGKGATRMEQKIVSQTLLATDSWQVDPYTYRVSVTFTYPSFWPVVINCCWFHYEKKKNI